MIKKLQKGEIFVFGSNLNGAHAGGAALQAMNSFDAELGVGEGLTGKCYAFPTLDKKMKKVSESSFKKSVKRLYTFAHENPDKKLLLTKVGCGIAGFEESWVKGQFKNAPENLIIPEDWKEVPAKVLYKFLREGMKSQHGNTTWKKNEWKKEASVSICNSGFHASDTPSQAFAYVQGEILAVVEARGESEIQEDKSVWEEMRVVKAYRWQKKDSVALSIFSAELVLKNFEKKFPKDKRPREAIEAAKAWVLNPTSENESVAWSAAWSARSAARSAAESAWSAAWSARSAARSAAESAWSAAWSVAWSARSAAWSAAESARKEITEAISDWFIEHIKEMEEIL